MSYINQVIKRTKPMTRCQCAVIAVMNKQWTEVNVIWKRGAIYCDNKNGRMRNVAYGTICAILRGLVQQGFAEVRKVKRREYRLVTN